MKFSNKKHGQVRKGLRIVHMPASEMLIFNKTNHLTGILVEEELASSDVNNCKLDAANVGTHQGNWENQLH